MNDATKCQTCGAPTFRSADGTDRCKGCHLHGCDCTCAGRGRDWFLFLVGLVTGQHGGALSW